MFVFFSFFWKTWEKRVFSLLFIKITQPPMNQLVRGFPIDNETRCIHWKGPNDIIALKFKCCPTVFFPCYTCHNVATTHKIEKFDLNIDYNVKCILCGHCKSQLTFKQYTTFQNDLQCPMCKHKFNQSCKLHYNLYFNNIPINQNHLSCQA